MSKYGNPGLTTRWMFLSLCIASSVVPAVGSASLSGGGSVPVVVRVQGLALGSRLQLGRMGETLVATLNDEYVFGNPGTPGTALGLVVSGQPAGQFCDVSELAPATVPADSAAVFVRCRSLPGASVIVPETPPAGPLRILRGESAVRRLAYPGLPYESRLGVVGGTFPYEFRVVAATMGGVPVPLSTINVDFRRGTIRFTPETETSISIDIEIRDSAEVQRVLTHNIVVDSAVAPFVFIAPDGIDSSDRGSLAQPYRTLAYALPRTNASQEIMLRRGTYVTGGFSINDSQAKTIIAFPDEVPQIDLNYAGAF